MPVLSVEWLLALAIAALTLVSLAALIVAGTAFTTMRGIANTLFPDPNWLERPPGAELGQFENLTVSNVLSGQRDAHHTHSQQAAADDHNHHSRTFRPSRVTGSGLKNPAIAIDERGNGDEGVVDEFTDADQHQPAPKR